MSSEVVTFREYPARKIRQFNTIVELSQKYRVIALAKLTKVRSAQIMEMRKAMRDQLKILVVKNKIAIKGLAEVKKPRIEKLLNHIKGQNLFIFTDMNPFKLNLMLEKNKVLLPAKAGDIATDRIVVPAGNTGLAPGPVLSEFKDCKIITKIEGGSIWVTKDTIVAEPGSVISPKLASLLSKLGIKPIKAGLTLDVVYWDGMVLTSKDIHLDLEKYHNNITSAIVQSFSLAFNSGYPASKEVTSTLLIDAFTKALALATKSNYLTEETTKVILANAEMNAYRLSEIARKKGF